MDICSFVEEALGNNIVTIGDHEEGYGQWKIGMYILDLGNLEVM